jgi:hypothetical protein
VGADLHARLHEEAQLARGVAALAEEVVRRVGLRQDEPRPAQGPVGMAAVEVDEHADRAPGSGTSFAPRRTRVNCVSLESSKVSTTGVLPAGTSIRPARKSAALTGW